MKICFLTTNTHITGVRELSAREYYVQYNLRKAQEAERRTVPISAEAEEAADLESKCKGVGYILISLLCCLFVIIIYSLVCPPSNLSLEYISCVLGTSFHSPPTHSLPSLPPSLSFSPSLHRGHHAIPHRR